MKLNYRPEIDGLRALAVTAVILYHLEIFYGSTQIISGGFVGVDIFFVISGFLITSLLLVEHDKMGRISIINFYERRARRLLPALFIVILVTLPLAWIYLIPAQLIDYSRSALATLFFGSNFYWHLTLQQYGAESALLKPLLHTWTLAVEEQYYAIFPVFLLAIFRWCHTRIALVFVFILILSLALAEHMSRTNPSYSFYLLPTRLWELLAGSLLAQRIYRHSNNKQSHFLSKFMPFLGLSLILTSVIFFNLKILHPGLYTLLPVIGTVLIIGFQNEDELVTKILSSRILVRIGLVSYSLYLWHYPVIAFGRILDPSPTWEDRAIWILITIILSIVTYFCIEKPFRKKNTIPTRPFICLAVLSMVIIAAASMLFIQYASNRVVEIDFGVEMSKRTAWQDYGFDVCKQIQIDDCPINQSDKPTILIVGDSMAPDALRLVAKQYPNFKYILSSSGWCIPTRVKLQVPRVSLKKCNHINKVRFDSKSFTGVDGVVINTIDYGQEVFLNVSETPTVADYISFLQKNNIHNIMLIGTYLQHSPRIVDLYIKTGGNKKDILERLKIENKNDDLVLKKISKKHNAEFISIREKMCTNQKDCSIFINGFPYSWDNHHWTLEFTDYLTSQLSDRFENSWLETLDTSD